MSKDLGLPFFMGQGLLGKLNYVKEGILETFNLFSEDKTFFLSVGENFTFANACAVWARHGTKKLLNKNCAKEDGPLAKPIRS